MEEQKKEFKLVSEGNDEWANLSEADKQFFKDYANSDFKKMQTNLEIIALPSKKTAVIYCDGRAFIQD